MYVVIVNGGFMMAKDDKDLLESDIIICKCSNDQDCSDIIHGKRKKV